MTDPAAIAADREADLVAKLIRKLNADARTDGFPHSEHTPVVQHIWRELLSERAARIAAEAEVKRLREAGEALRKDMVDRADWQLLADGDTYKRVNAGRTVWHDFCAALTPASAPVDVRPGDD